MRDSIFLSFIREVSPLDHLLTTATLTKRWRESIRFTRWRNR